MRKPVLVLGLGNPLMGDDGIGWHIAESLAHHPRLADAVEVMPGGSDLLRLAPRIEGRRHLVLIDAVLDSGRVGTVRVSSNHDELELAQSNAHELSAAQALDLLRAVMPGLSSTALTWITVAVRGARVSNRLTRELSEQLPHVLDRVLAVVNEVAAAATPEPQQMRGS